MNTHSVTTALLAGALGGIVGTCAMAACDAAWSALDNSGGRTAQARRLRRSGVRGWPQAEPRSHEGPDTPSEKLARRLSGVATGRKESAAGSALHFAFGATAGAAYAAALHAAPPAVARALRSGHGVTYGTLVWLLADEIGVPLMGLAPSPSQTPPRLHGYALAGHFAYGLALESIRRLVTAQPTRSSFRSA